jgi:TRAP-type mannitol/chloroaromatic compound transport system substrate-binding protein
LGRNPAEADDNEAAKSLVITGREYRMKWFTSAAAAAALLAAATTAQAQQIDAVRWPVPMAFGSNLVALGDAMPWVAQQLDKMSGGRIKLQVFEPGKLVPALAVFDSVADGKSEAGYTWMGYEVGKVPAAALFGAVPFGMESPEFMAWMYFGGGNELLRELFKPHNVYPIFCGTIGPEGAGWFRKEINSADDIKGLKFRAAGYGGDIYKEVGASVTLLPGGELFQALEKGVLDGTEFSLPTVDEQLGFYKVAKFYYMPGWHQPSTNQYLYVNLAAWNKISPATQAMIETTCTAAVTIALAKSEALQGKTLAKFEKEGVQVKQVNPALLKVFQAATKKVMAEKAAANAQFKKVYDSQQAFMAQNQKWKEFGYLPRDFK